MGATKAAPAKRRARGQESATAGEDRRTWPYRFEMVPLSRLLIDVYQRPLTSFVETVAAEYDPALLGCLIGSERPEGTVAVIDGQTRAEAMRRNAETHAPFLIYTGLSLAQEAGLFADLQTKRRGMASYLRFRSALIARRPEATAIAQIVRDAGFELGVDMTPHTVKAIAALEKVYRRDTDGELLRTVMGVIARAWPNPDTEGRVSGDMIGGLGVFLSKERNVDVDRLVDRLSAVDPRTVRHRANALQEGSGSGTGGRAAYMADAILGIYMRGKGRGVASAVA